MGHRKVGRHRWTKGIVAKEFQYGARRVRAPLKAREDEMMYYNEIEHTWM
jgi:hypothetical protein